MNLKLTNNLLLAKLVIYGMIVFLISFFISNKVAGPIFRFEQSCEEIGEGDLTYRVRLRKSDELIDLQDKFNLMVDSLQSKMHRVKQLGHELNTQDSAKIKELQDEINKQFKLD